MMTLAPALALLLAASPVTVQFNGGLKDAIRAIAKQGGLNVLVEGPLDEQVQVDFNALPADDALRALARIHHLELTQEGAVWVLKAAPRPGPVEAASPVPPAPPLPPAPPAPPVPEHEQVLAELEQQVEQAESAVDEAEAVRERVREEAQARKEKIRALKAAAKARARGDEASSRDLVGRGQVVVKTGTVVESATALGGPLMIEKGAVVEGDAVSFGGDVVLQDDAVVEGDAVSFGGQVVRSGSARVEGEEASFSGHGAPHVVASAASEGPGRVGSFLALFAVLFVTGFLSLMVAPQRVKRLEDAIRAAPVRTGLLGFLAALALLPVTLLLVVIIIGIPVAVVLWLFLPLVVLLGTPAVASVVGAALPLGRVRKTQALVLAVGLAVLLLASSLPWVGWAVISGICLMAFGAMVTTRFGQPPRGLPVPDFGRTSSMPG